MTTHNDPPQDRAPERATNGHSLKDVFRIAAPRASVEGRGSEECARCGTAPLNYPEPLQSLGEYLTGLLDSDQWAKAERMLHDVGRLLSAAPAREAGPVAWGIKCIDTAPPIYEVMVGDYCYLTFASEATANAYHRNIIDREKFAVFPLYAAPPASAVTEAVMSAIEQTVKACAAQQKAHGTTEAWSIDYAGILTAALTGAAR